MGTEILGILTYFLTGVVALGIFEVTTKRLSRGLRNASYDTQDTLARQNIAAPSKRAATIIIAGLIFVFWPAVFVGAIQGYIEKRRGKNNGEEK